MVCTGASTALSLSASDVSVNVTGGAVILMTIFSVPPGQSVSLDSAYHSLNRTILFQLSRPLARLTGEKVNNGKLKQLLVSLHLTFSARGGSVAQWLGRRT